MQQAGVQAEGDAAEARRSGRTDIGSKGVGRQGRRSAGSRVALMHGRALEKVLERLGLGGRAAAMTLGELVDEYLEMHDAEPVTIAKLRWLLRKSTAALGEVRLADLSPKEVYAWRLTVPEGHRFEATQALRQVLDRAVAWGLIDYNPAKRGVANPGRRRKEKRPLESW